MSIKPMFLVVQVGGLHFRFDRLRARRAFRGLASLIDVLGPGTAALISGGGESNGVSSEMLTKAGGLSAVMRVVVGAAFQAGKIGNPDALERAANELLAWTPGEGTRYSEDGEIWIPVRGLVTLDAFGQLGHMEVLDLMRHTIEFNFFPTSAGPDTSDGTGPAAATTPETYTQHGASSGAQTSAQSGLASG